MSGGAETWVTDQTLYNNQNTEMHSSFNVDKNK